MLLIDELFMHKMRFYCKIAKIGLCSQTPQLRPQSLAIESATTSAALSLHCKEIIFIFYDRFEVFYVSNFDDFHRKLKGETASVSLI